jgi:hypothetical protein
VRRTSWQSLEIIQLIVLSAGGARDDGIAAIPEKINRTAASKVGASLVTRKLMREVRSKPGMPVWRNGEDDRPISLMITRAGRNAIGVKEAAPAEALRSSNKRPEEKDAPTLETRSQDRFGAKETIDDRAALPSSGTKQALVIEMLCAKKGATLDTLIGPTGCAPSQ